MTNNRGPISGPELGLAEFSQSALIVDPQVARDLIARPAMSASTMKALETCPARLAVDKAAPRRPDPFGPAEIGDKGHKVLEELMQLPGQQRTRERATRIIHRLGVEEFPGPEEKLRGRRGLWAYEVWAAIRGAWDLLDLPAVDTHRVEWPIGDLTIAGVPFQGFIDLSRNVGTGLSVDDWKTGAKLPVIKTQGDTHGDQVRLYVKAVQTLTGDKPAEANLFYTRLGVRKRVALAPSRVKDTVERFKQAWDLHNGLIERARFPLKPSALCGWCPLVASCPAARRDGCEQRNPQMHLIEVPVEQTHHIPTELTAETHIQEAADNPSTAEPDSMPGEQATQEASMSDSTADRTRPPLYFEDKPYVQEAGGQVNPSSYAFINALTVVQWARAYLDRRGIRQTARTVQVTVDVLDDLIAEVQYRVAGSTDWQRGSRSRAMYAVRQELWAHPIPFGEPADTLATWRDGVAARAERTVLLAIDLWNRTDDPAEPWLKLADLVPTRDAAGADLDEPEAAAA